MKKIFSILSILALAVSAYATGNEGVNPPQSGVINPAINTTSITNTFAFPFQTTPVMIVYSAQTNGTPITNSITTTNFTLSWPVNGSTNASFAWQAFVGGTKMAFGTATNGIGNTSVAFPFAYASAPVVLITGNNTNGVVAVSAITATNFTINSLTAQTNSWESIGTVYNPQSEYTGPFPINNKVLTP